MTHHKRELVQTFVCFLMNIQFHVYRLSDRKKDIILDVSLTLFHAGDFFADSMGGGGQI